MLIKNAFILYVYLPIFVYTLYLIQQYPHADINVHLKIPRWQMVVFTCFFLLQAAVSVAQANFRKILRFGPWTILN